MPPHPLSSLRVASSTTWSTWPGRQALWCGGARTACRGCGPTCLEGVTSPGRRGPSWTSPASPPCSIAATPPTLPGSSSLSDRSCTARLLRDNDTMVVLILYHVYCQAVWRSGIRRWTGDLLIPIKRRK